MSREMELLREQTETVYLHVDLDVLDPAEGTANAFSAPGGLRVDQVLELIATVRGALRIGALALTAYDPSFDTDGRVQAAALRIAAAVADAA